MDGRFPKRARLAKREEISLVKNTGRDWRCQHFIVVSQVNALSMNRFAVLVGRRIGSAVIRNKIKRKFREVIRTHNWERTPYLDILIIPRQTAASAKPQNLEAGYEEWKKSIQ